MTRDEPCEALVVAIGNPDRGDDGLGAAVAARLRAQAPANVCIAECRGDVLALLDRWSRYKIVIVVDAAARDREPGRVRRFDLANDTLPAMFGSASTHALGLAEAVELARALGRLPGKLIAYAVEGEDFAIGAPLSPMVAAAVAPVTALILGELMRSFQGATANA